VKKRVEVSSLLGILALLLSSLVAFRCACCMFGISINIRMSLILYFLLSYCASSSPYDPSSLPAFSSLVFPLPSSLPSMFLYAA